FDELHARALNAFDDPLPLLGHRAADEAFRIPPQIAVINAGSAAELGFEHFEILLTDKARHFLILDLDGAHCPRRAGLLAPRLFPAAIEQMRVERPGLRQLQFFVPPYMAIGTRVDELSLSLCLSGSMITIPSRRLVTTPFGTAFMHGGS